MTMWRSVSSPPCTLPQDLGGALLCVVAALGFHVIPASAEEPTWAANARGMISRCCVRCHDGTGPGAYPLRTAEEVAAKRGTVLKVLELHTMPPFLPTRDSLVVRPPEPTEAELTLFKAWCDAGAPLGADTAPAAAPVDLARSLRPAITMTDQFPVTPEEQRTMRSFQVPLQSERALLIGGVRASLQEPGLIARIHLNAMPVSEAARLDELDSAPGFRLTGDGGGSPAGSLGGCGIDGNFRLPAGYAVSIPAGSALVAEAHADGRGKLEAGGFSLELLAPVPRIDEEGTPHIRTCETLLVGAQNAASDVAEGLDHTLETAPLSRSCEVIALSLRPGVYATRASLSLTRPGESPLVVVDIPRFDVHQDQPYVLREPLRVPAGSTVTLSTGHPTDSTARKAIPQAVLLVAVDEAQPSDIAMFDQAGPPLRPDSVTSSAIAELLSTTVRVGTLEVTRELSCAQVEALFPHAGEPSTGGVPACGLTWYEALHAANALSSMTGLTPRYVVGTAAAAPRHGKVTALVSRAAGTGWRLPTDEEWSVIARSGLCPDAIGSVWEWCDTEAGESRVVRGGCWADTAAARNADARAEVEPATRSELFGARLVRRVNAPTPP